MANGDGWAKPIGIGVAIFVLGAAIVGAAGNTVANSLNQRTIQSQVKRVQEDIIEQKEITKNIDVMAEQIDDIKDDVAKILEKLDKE